MSLTFNFTPTRALAQLSRRASVFTKSRFVDSNGTRSTSTDGHLRALSSADQKRLNRRHSGTNSGLSALRANVVHGRYFTEKIEDATTKIINLASVSLLEIVLGEGQWVWQCHHAGGRVWWKLKQGEEGSHTLSANYRERIRTIGPTVIRGNKYAVVHGHAAMSYLHVVIVD